MQIGRYPLPSNVIAAPMAGVTDLPFRRLCKRFGAGLAVSEMISAKPETWSTDKSRARINHEGEAEPRAVQIAGADPQQMAAAARYNVERGAQIVDINMGCPAKKVCNVMAGSALLRDEALVASIVGAVVRAVDVPVTLKIRTGWDQHNRNAVRVARIAREEGVQALAMHGRTRACGFGGEAEYDTIAEVKAAVNLPLVANGDIRTPQQAKHVLEYTGADAIMIGRAAQGRPWIFREINHYLATNEILPPPEVAEIRDSLLEHLQDLYAFYGTGEREAARRERFPEREAARRNGISEREAARRDCVPQGVRIARKHIQWYTKELAGGKQFWTQINEVESVQEQLTLVRRFFHSLAERDTRLAYIESEGEALTA